MAKLVKLFEEKDGKQVRVPDYYYSPATGVIYFTKRVNGELVRFSTGVKYPNIRKAKEVGNARLKNKLNHTATIRLLIGELFEQFLEESDKDVRRGELDSATLSKRHQAWNQLKGFWKERRPEEITVDTWAEYIDYFESTFPGQSLFNARKYFSVFSRQLNHKIYNGRPILAAVPLFKNPFAAKERQARKKKKSRIFTHEEISKLIQHSNPDEKILILLMALMAFRIAEACSLKWERLDLKAGYYDFVEDENKAGHEGRQAIPKEALKELRERYKASEADFVFPQLTDRTKPIRPQMIDWRALKNKSGVTWHWTPHTFRHWCLTQLFSNAALAQPAIMKCYRISYKVALEHYIHIDDRTVETLRDALSITGAST